MGDGERPGTSGGDDTSSHDTLTRETGDAPYFPDLTLGKAWGESITKRRADELEQLAAQQRAWVATPEPERGESCFTGVPLTGADVFWLAARALAGTNDEQTIAAQIEMLRQGPAAFLNVAALHLERAHLSEAHLEGAHLIGTHLEGADLREAHLEGATLRQAHLEGADLWQAHLEGATLRQAHLEGATLWQAHLERANLPQAHLERANLWQAHLERANLWQAHLEGADLPQAHLEGATLRQAHLEGATLWQAHLEGADLTQAHLESKTYPAGDADYLRIQRWMPLGRDFPATLSPADVRGAFFDAATDLKGAVLGDERAGGVSVADVRWGDVNLAVVDWSAVGLLGDEREARKRANATSASTSPDEATGKKLSRADRRAARQQAATARLQAYQDAARANRQLATVLRNQGLTDEADRFAYRAQLLQRAVLRRQGIRKWPSYIGSLLLDALAGYGFRPGRSILVYVAVIVWFANFYVWASHGLFSLGLPPSRVQPLLWYEGLILSVSSFHGRGFQPFQNLNDPIAALAGMQAVLGLVIEVSFIATFTQRFFGK